MRSEALALPTLNESPHEEEDEDETIPDELVQLIQDGLEREAIRDTTILFEGFQEREDETFSDGLVQSGTEREVKDATLLEPTQCVSLSPDSKQEVMRFGLSKDGKTNGTIPRSWRDEALVFRDKQYAHYAAPRAAHHRRRTISVQYLELRFPQTIDIGGDGLVYVSIEIADSLQEHPERWARKATEQDPGRSLSLQVTGKDSSGSDFTFRPKTNGKKDVFRANSSVDLLLFSKSDAELAETPRRYLYMHKGCPKELEDFIGGKYTSEWSD